MSGPRPGWSDGRLEQVMGTLLRTGLLLAATVVFVGGVIFTWRHATEVPSYRVFRGEPSELRHAWTIVGSALDGSGRGIIQLGLLLLIATPVARVAFAVVGFAMERDRLYVAISLTVLTVLLISLLG
jgi:uncharacterized membrane protein